MANQKLITTKIAAEMLGFSQDYIRQLCASGKIKAQKLSHDWIMDRQAIKHVKRQRNKRDIIDGSGERSSEVDCEGERVAHSE